MIETKIPSTNGKDSLHVVIWEPVGEIDGIVQISHGMVEYVKRYDEFARYLNTYGFLVIGNDHIGHGETAKEEDLGYFGEGKSKTVVDDLDQVTLYAKSTYGADLPIFLFGHSMGSFMARRFIMEYGRDINGVIISGTGYTPPAVVGAGKFIASVIRLFHGERYRSEFLKNMAFGSYNKRIENLRTPNDWLTKETEVVDKYNQDKFCTFKFTVNGYQTLFGVLSYIQNKQNIRKIPKNLPVLLISGEEDPVGFYGEGVKTVFRQMKAEGIRDMKMKLYPGDRHELTNETDRTIVYKDIKDWLEAHMELGGREL